MADYYEIQRRLNGVSGDVAALRRLLEEIMDSSTGHTHNKTDSAGGSLAGLDITASAAEINVPLDGVSANVTATNLNALTGGTDVARSAGGHGHQLAAGASDVTALIAEVNAVCDDANRTAGAAGVTAKRFVKASLEAAGVDALDVVGASPTGAAVGVTFPLQSFGIHPVAADAPLAVDLPVKVGTGGRATKHATSQTVLQAAATGEIGSFTQPGVATTLEILQAADVAGDRGRGIVIVGSNGAGAFITETIALDGTNTTTAAVGVTSFTKVSAVYTADGAVLGAQNVTIQASGGGAVVCTLAGASSELGADIPSGTTEAYCNEITIAAAVQDATFVTLVGYDSADALTGERVQLNNATPSKIASTKVWRSITRICLGELTAIAVSVKTNETTDTASMQCGRVVVAAAARDNDALVLLLPNVPRLQAHTHASAAEAGTLALAAVADVTMTAANINLLDDGGDIARAAGGHGHLLAAGASDVTATSAQVNTLTRDAGKQAVAVMDVNTGAAEAGCKVTVGGVDYQEADAEDFPNGVWTNGATAANSATSLAAAVNGDTRNGGSPFTAIVAGAGHSVVLGADAAGVAGNAVITTTSAGRITVETAHGGAAAALKRTYAVQYAVTAQDALALEVNIPVPFTPTAFVVQYLASTGAPLATQTTDVATIQAAPARIRILQAGGTHLVQGDIVQLVVFE